MISFEEELKKFKPQLTVEDMENGLQEDEMQDILDLLEDLMKIMIIKK